MDEEPEADGHGGEYFKRHASGKQMNIKKATKLKEEGNIEMKNENYTKAEICYTEGLELVRDMKGRITVNANGYVNVIRT